MSVFNHRKTWSRFKKQARRSIYKARGKTFYHFLHIGKTGGTAIKHALEPYSRGRGYVIYFHPHGVRLRDIPPGEKVFFFLRDPVSRFTSGFYSRQRKGWPRYDNGCWGEQEREAFENFETPNQLALGLSSSDERLKQNALSAMANIKHVRDSYWDWFEDEAYFKSRLSDIALIGFQENLDACFEVLKSEIGVPAAVQLPSDAVQSHRNPEHLDTGLEEEALANITRWYDGDFAFLALCKSLLDQGIVGAAVPDGVRAVQGNV